MCFSLVNHSVKRFDHIVLLVGGATESITLGRAKFKPLVQFLRGGHRTLQIVIRAQQGL